MTTTRTKYSDVFARITRGENIPDELIHGLPEPPIGSECYGSHEYTALQTLVSVLPSAVELVESLDSNAGWESICRVISYNAANKTLMQRESIKEFLWELGALADFIAELRDVNRQ